MDMLWSGWGDPGRAAPLPDQVTGLLRDLLGVKPRETATVALEDLDVPASPLAPDAHRALAAALGDEAHVRTDAGTRVRHTRGKSTPTCCASAAATSPPRSPRPCCCPPRTTRCSPCSVCAPNTA